MPPLIPLHLPPAGQSPGVPWAVSPPGTPLAPGPGSELGLWEGTGLGPPKMGLGRDPLVTAERHQDTMVSSAGGTESPFTLPLLGRLIHSQPLIN